MLFTESEEWIKKLTSEEIKAIEKYAYNPGDEKPNRFFERLNAMLRGEREPEEKIMKYAEVISEAIRKNKLTHDIIVYRGVWTDVTAGVSVGSVFKWNQFTSTSVLPEAAFDKPFKLIIYVRRGANAAYIEKLSKFPKQKELLLDRSCMYRLLSKKGNVAELEVVL